MSSEDERHIRAAMRLAEQAMSRGDHPFGALLVREGEVLLEAENTVVTDQDITRHAELNLVSRASTLYDPQTLSKCTLYTSTEPCVMCAGAIYWSGISRVVYACSAKRVEEIAGSGFVVPCDEIFARGGREVEVVGPLLEEEAIKPHERFWR